MAVRSKTGLGKVERRPRPPKRTKQGQGKRSRANHGRKQWRGQGRP